MKPFVVSVQPLSEATQHLRDASRPCQMQAVPTLELLSMDELNSLDMDEDFADLNLDMYLNQPETSGSSSSDGASCCAVRQNLKTHIQRKRRERGELKELTALTNCDQDEPQGQNQQVRRPSFFLFTVESI